MHFTTDELIDLHAELRAKERYGLFLTDDDRAAMVEQIKENRAIYFAKKPGRKSIKIWMVWWESARRVVPVYYRGGKILTILPDGAVGRYMEGWSLANPKQPLISSQ